jgi:hypothetical protein
MAPKGALVVDDVDANWGFRSFTLTFPGQQSMIREAEPLRPDLRRFNKKGLFGVILKRPVAQAWTLIPMVWGGRIQTPDTLLREYILAFFLNYYAAPRRLCFMSLNGVLLLLEY